MSGREAIVGVGVEESGLAAVTVSAERHVHAVAANHVLAEDIFISLGRAPEREAGVLLAELADGLQLLDLLAFGNECYDVGELVSLEVSLRG